MRQIIGIHLGTQGVSVVRTDVDGHVEPTVVLEPPNVQEGWRWTGEQLNVLVERLRQCGVSRHAILCLSVPVTAVYFRRVAWSQSMTRQPDALRFAVESQLPQPLDQMHVVAGCEPDEPPVASHDLEKELDGETPSGNASGTPVVFAGTLAIPRQPWQALLERLDAEGWVCPAVYAGPHVLWHGLQDGVLDHSQPAALIVLGDQGGFLVVGQDRHIAGIRPLPKSLLQTPIHTDRLRSEILRTWWSVHGTTSPLLGVLVCDNDLSLSDLSAMSGCRMLQSGEAMGHEGLSVDGAQALAAVRYWQSNQRAAGQLCVDSWRSGVIRCRNRFWSMTHAVAAGVVLLVMAGAMVFHGLSLRHQNVAYQAHTRQVWAELFPDSAPPIDVVSRLISEQARERGLRGTDQSVPIHESAINVFRQFAAALPPEVPVRISQLEISDRSSVISGEAKSHGEVEQITNQLRTQANLTVQPPSSERTEQGLVRFTIRFETKEAAHDAALATTH